MGASWFRLNGDLISAGRYMILKTSTFESRRNENRNFMDRSHSNVGEVALPA